MISLSEEMKNGLAGANTNEEVISILKDGGVELDDANQEEIIREVKELMNAEGRELSLDELEAIGGGLEHIERDYAESGCQATVEHNSRCWSSDACSRWEVCYTNEPAGWICHIDGTWLYKTGRTDAGRPGEAEYRCRVCGMTIWH